MNVRFDTFEYFLIKGTLIFSFFYFVLRFLLFDNFLWLIVFPLICFSYILLYSERFTFNGFNSLDKIVYIYILFGFLMTILGLYISNKLIIIQVFVHYYLPAIIYFISRKYTSYSLFNFFKVIQVIWLLAVILIIDVLIEGILYKNNLSSLLPWAYLGEKGIVKYSIEWYGLGFNRVGSILTSSKTVEMVLASLFCFLFPFSMNYKTFNKHNLKLFINKWNKNRSINIMILFLIPVCSIGILKLSNKTALISILVVLLLYSIRKISIKSLLLTLSVIVAVAFIYQDFLIDVYTANFITVHYKFGFLGGKTVPEYIFNFPLIIEGYKGHYFFDYIFGKYLASGVSSSYPFAFFTELRLFSTPLYFGLIWTSIVITMGILVVKYCFKLINTRKSSYLSYLGLSFIGFYLIYFFDIHYPVFIRHGPIELFFILTGALSSFNSCFLDKEIHVNL